MLKEAVVDGLCQIGADQGAQIVGATHFQTQGDKIVAFCPRPRLRSNDPVPEDIRAMVRDYIERGLRVNGFHDWIWVQP